METTKQIQQFQQVDEVSLVYRTKTPISQRLKITGSTDAFRAFLASWDENSIEHHEEFKTMLLNRANKVLGIITISQGGLSGTIIDVRLIFQAAIKANASHIILCHNHPSGNLKPSESDVSITKKIRDGAKLLDIQVLDHLILVRGEGYFSFSDEGLI